MESNQHLKDINKSVDPYKQSLISADSAPRQAPERPPQESKIKVEFRNIGLLIRKNFFLTIKNPKNLIFLIVAPFILSALMLMFQKLADDVTTRAWIDNPIQEIPQLTKCYGQDCISLIYMTIVSEQTVQKSPAWVNHTIEYIRRHSSVGDIKKGPEIQDADDWDVYRKDLDAHPNKTQIGIVFCIDSDFEKMGLQFLCASNEKYRFYYLLLNKTDSFGNLFSAPRNPLPTDRRAVALKVLIDNALLDYEKGGNFQTKYINYDLQQYPTMPNRALKGFDIVTQAGAFYYLITPLFGFLFIQNEIVREKELKLRQGLNVFGASHFSYWFSWVIVSIFYSAIIAVSTISSGLAFSLALFQQTPFEILFILFFVFCLAMQALSYFIATLVPNLKTANSISYGFVLFAIVVEGFLADVNLLHLIFETDPGPLLVFLKGFLSLYPPFSYSKIFAMITEHSGFHFNVFQNKWEKGEGYSWKLFKKEMHGKTITSGKYVEYSALTSVYVLLANIAFYVVLTWYFDHVVQSNRGGTYSYWFFLQKSFWMKTSKKKKKEMSVDDLRNPAYNIRDQEESVVTERRRVINNFSNQIPAYGMRIKGLSKTFTQICPKTRLQALKNLSIEIQSNELMAVLGHNGAGKTTLINILTGVMSPDPHEELEIVINNKSIEDLGEIRRHIGVCPQFDLLWKEMTAYEHLRLYARLKAVPSDIVDQKIDEMLKFVSLLEQKNAKVSSFSGGMKRRLSLAIAAVGNPKIIFLDQPTTGLDPKVRQQVWTLIQRLKKNKSIILTTHSMVEADVLSDRIAILVKGKLKCIGTSIYLKQNYGSGYRIAINTDDDKADEVMKYIRKLFPEADQVDSNGGNLLVGIQTYKHLIEFIKMLEAKESSGLDEYSMKKDIRDWNVSHTTLEEVFMRVTKKTEGDEE